MVSLKQRHWGPAFVLLIGGYKSYDGAAHEFFGLGAVLDDAKAAQQQAAAGLKKGF